MRLWVFVTVLLLLVVTGTDAAKKTNKKAPAGKADDAADEPVAEKKNVKQKHAKIQEFIDEENTIEDVDEDKIDEYLRDATKNLVIFFYDGRAACPQCGDALKEVEEIDDDIEATGYVQVVKTDDRSVAKELGITTFPSLVYFRRKNPILYDGDFKDSEVLLRWLRSHEDVVSWDLTDDNFEWKTDSHSPDEGTLDWFVMFYNAENPACHAYTAVWETVAHKLRGLVDVGRVEMGRNDDVSERFHVEKSECPSFLLFHRGKMYRYKDAARDVRSLYNFAMFKFKEQRGHRVPDPPSALERVYELVKEKVADALDDSQTMSVLAVGGLLLMVSATLIIKAYRIKQAEAHKHASDKNQ